MWHEIVVVWVWGGVYLIKCNKSSQIEPMSSVEPISSVVQIMDSTNFKCCTKYGWKMIQIEPISTVEYSALFYIDSNHTHIMSHKQIEITSENCRYDQSKLSIKIRFIQCN